MRWFPPTLPYTLGSQFMALVSSLNNVPPSAMTGLKYGDKHVVAISQPGKPVKTARHNPKWWPDSKKVEAATLHVALGDMERVSTLTKVPLKELQEWKKQDWWLTTQQQVKREGLEKMDAAISNVLDGAIAKMADTIENGDSMYDIKRGTVVKVPMTGRDLAIVAGTMFDKRQLIRGEATKITKTEDQAAMLEKLAEKFAALSKTTPKSISSNEVVDAEYIETER